MCSTLNSCFSSRQSAIASSRGIVEPLERLVGLDDLRISASMRGKSSSESGCSKSEVVVEAGAGRGAERQLHAVEQPHHGLGHDVGGAVPHDGQRFGVFLGEQPEADFAVGRAAGCGGRPGGRRLRPGSPPWPGRGRFRPRRRRPRRGDRTVCGCHRAELRQAWATRRLLVLWSYGRLDQSGWESPRLRFARRNGRSISRARESRQRLWWSRNDHAFKRFCKFFSEDCCDLGFGYLYK